MSSEIRRIPVGKIIITGENPRQEFELEYLRRLGESIVSHGLLQPIIVRPKEDYYELVVGERRLKAYQLVGLEEIEAKIQVLDDATCTELRLIENAHREDLTDAEKGDAVYVLMEKYPERYPTIKSVSDAINVPYNTVMRTWCGKSRKLSPKVKQLVIDNTLPETHSLLLLKYDHSTQDKLAELMTKHKLTQRQARDFLRLYDADPTSNLDNLAVEVLGVKRIEIRPRELSEEARKEVEKILEERKKKAEEARRKSLEKTRKKKRKVPKAELEAAAKLAAKELREEEVKKALERRLMKEKDRRLKIPSKEEVTTSRLEEIPIPFAVISRLERSIKDPSRQVALAKAMVENKLNVWGRTRLIELAKNAPWASVADLVKMVKDESVEGIVLMLEIDPKQRKALYSEMEKRGEERLKDVVKALLNEKLGELGYW